MNIFLQESVIKDLDYNNYDIATYIALRSLYDSRRDEFYISVRMIAYELYGTSEIPERALKHIRESIYNLETNGFCEIVDEFSKGNDYIVSPLGLYLERYNSSTGKGDYYTIVSLDEVRTIMNSSTSKDKFALLRFFVIVVGSFNRGKNIMIDDNELKNYCGNISLSYLGKKAGIDKNVANSYFRLLEDINLLFVYRHDKAIIDDNGDLKSMTNHYGRYKHKEYIIKTALADENDVKTIPMTNANQKRKLAAKYNMLKKNPEKYLLEYKDELLDIYKYIEVQNLNLKEKKYDESIFDGIDCITKYRSKNDLDKIKFSMDELFDNLFDTEDCDSEVD